MTEKEMIDNFFNNFIRKCTRTEKVLDELNVNREILVNLFNMYIQISEILDGIKKATFYNKDTKYVTELYSRISTIRKLCDLCSSPIFDQRNKSTKGDIINNISPRVFHAILGKMTETGELASAIVEALNNSQSKIDIINIQEELGDDAWYNSILYDELNISMRTTLEKVINKLLARYPDMYSDELADQRDLQKERKVLEQ